LTLPTKKIQALLAYLALPPGREHARDKLAALLWGDLSQGHARHSLRQALFALRQALEPVRPACLRVEGATIALNPEAVDVDAMSFERLVGERHRRRSRRLSSSIAAICSTASPCKSPRSRSG
jgi:DNA-binding SARP family transcriptional activator